MNSDTSYLTPAPNLINDVFNHEQNKQISGFSRPFMLVIIVQLHYARIRRRRRGHESAVLGWRGLDLSRECFATRAAQ